MRDPTRRASGQVPAVFDFETKGTVGESVLKRRPGGTPGAGRGGAPWARAENSDGKPCSGVRGGQQVSTDFFRYLLNSGSGGQKGCVESTSSVSWMQFHGRSVAVFARFSVKHQRSVNDEKK